VHLASVVTLLASENDSHGFRYFNPNVGTIPELPWTRDVVDALVCVVGDHVEAQGHRFPPEGVAKMQFVIGKLPRWDAVPRERRS
jgi:hypothetical protein